MLCLKREFHPLFNWIIPSILLYLSQKSALFSRGFGGLKQSSEIFNTTWGDLRWRCTSEPTPKVLLFDMTGSIIILLIPTRLQEACSYWIPPSPAPLPPQKLKIAEKHHPRSVADLGLGLWFVCARWSHKVTAIVLLSCGNRVGTPASCLFLPSTFIVISV